MNQDELKILLAQIEKFMEKEFKNFIPEMDLYPQKPLPFSIKQKFSELGVMKLTEQEDFNLQDAIKILKVVSAYCAGLGAYLSYALAGKILKKHLGLSGLDSLTGLCFCEEKDLNLESGSPEFVTNLSSHRIGGKKNSVMLAHDAEDFLVFGKMNGKDAIALVRKHAGVNIKEPVSLIGIRALSCADVEFETEEVNEIKECRKEDIYLLFGVLSLFLSVCATSTANEALNSAWKYAQERYQGGKIIREYDAIRLMYEKNSASVNSAISSIIKISEHESLTAPDFLRSAIETKIYSSEISVNATLDAIQMLGGYGYMRDYGIEKRFRDAVALSHLPLDSARLALFLNAFVEPLK
jgi:butyryl-CoA dehydrogenase